MTILIKGNKVITKPKCKGCTKHKLRKHFSDKFKWIEADSIRTVCIVTSEIILMLISTEKNRAKGQPHCTYIFNLSQRISYLAMYICGWPNNFLNGQILAEVFGRMS